MLKTAEKGVKLGLCDRCLGRQFRNAEEFQGLTNPEIGNVLRKIVSKNKKIQDVSKTRPSKQKKLGCKYCDNIFETIDQLLPRALEKLSKLQYENILAGSRISQKTASLEEKLWEKLGIQHCEPIKREIARTIGLAITEKTGKPAEFKNPDVTIIFDLVEKQVELSTQPLYVFGWYEKLKRGFPQTKWTCLRCEGKGCEYCEGKGQLYPESVQEYVEKPLLQKTKGTATKFHGAGREDIDAKNTAGRIFIIEILEPQKRNIRLEKVGEKINKNSKGKIRVHGLRKTDKQSIKTIKSEKLDKTYRATIKCAEEVNGKELEKLEQNFTQTILRQKTPSRVLHRRADKIRKRTVKKTKCRALKNKKNFSAKILCEAGTYVKELVSGDQGRTKPSFTSVLGKQCECVKLDVIATDDKKLYEKIFGQKNPR